VDRRPLPLIKCSPDKEGAKAHEWLRAGDGP
jgi:hypothetical protein